MDARLVTPLYDEVLHVPMFIHWRALDRTDRRDAVVSTIDLAPTLLELAGLTAPDTMQGRSLVPVLEDPAAPGRTAWLYEHFPVFPIPIPGITAIRTANYKYVEYQYDLRPRELFDLTKDPWQKRNAAGEENYAATLDSLQQAIVEWEETTDHAAMIPVGSNPGRTRRSPPQQSAPLRKGKRQ